MPIIYEKKDKIAIITINRPEAMNAIDPETSEELSKAWMDFRDDPSLWVAILTGAGDKAFSAGADLKKMIPFLATLSPFERREREEKCPGFGGITRRLNIWKPIIAAINGFCLAGGLEMALACDIRVAAEHATFGLMEVSRGIIPGAGGTQRLPRMIPVAKAMEMILMAQRIDAQEALRLGLVNRVVSRPRSHAHGHEDGRGHPAERPPGRARSQGSHHSGPFLALGRRTPPGIRPSILPSENRRRG